MKNNKQKPKKKSLADIVGRNENMPDICNHIYFKEPNADDIKWAKDKIQERSKQPDKVVQSEPVKSAEEIIEGICPNRPWFSGGKTDQMIVRCMESYASQFQNNNAISVIEGEREKFKFSSDPAKCRTGVEILNDILKILKA